jgi:hypothetical protein
MAMLGGTNESFLQHAKIGFVAYSLTSLGEYLLIGRRQPDPKAFFNARVMTTLVLPWIMFVVWYTLPAFYGHPMPSVAAEVIYANITLLIVGIVLLFIESDLEKLSLSLFKEKVLWFLWALSLVEMILFTFNIPWEDFFRG